MASKGDPVAQETDISGKALEKVDRLRRAANLSPAEWSAERIEAVVKMVAPSAKNLHEVAMFLGTCNRYQLDPTIGEVWLGQIRGRPTVMTGRDTYIKIAQRDKGYNGFDADVVREKDEFTVARDGSQIVVHHKKAGFARGKILGAYAVVYHQDRRPVYVEKHWDELKHLHGKDVWKDNPSEMILTRAVTFGLKLQFNLSGLYTAADALDEPETPSGTTLMEPRPATSDEPLDVEVEVVEEREPTEEEIRAEDRELAKE